MSASRKVRAAEGQVIHLLKERRQLLRLLKIARQNIHIKPPGLETSAISKWGREVSQFLPEFDHWNGQPLRNRLAVEAGEDLEPAGW